MKKLIAEDKRERFFAYFLHTLIDTAIVQGPILNKIYEQGTSDIATIRTAGKIQWHLENIDTLVAKLSMEEDNEATLQIRESKAMTELSRKAACDELFPDE